jgi:hypothetical protein
MFPHACGVDLERAVRNGADPAQVVPDDYVVVRGGTKPLPPAGEEFSGFVGPEVAAAGCALPHGQIRVSTAGAIRAAGGRVTWVPEFSPHGTLTLQHVHVVEVTRTTFGQLKPNPVPKHQRIDGMHRSKP